MLSSFITALLVTSALLPLVYIFLKKRMILDIPNERSSHSAPVPRGAGIALIIGVTVVLMSRAALPFGACIPLVGLGLLGAIDDFHPLPAKARLLFQVTLGSTGALYVIFTIGSDSPTGLTFILFMLAAGAILLPVTVNVFNFMDGVNGISAVHLAFFGVTYALILEHCGQNNFAILGWVLAAAAVAFVPWNFGKQARMFLGDSGSYFAGAGIGLLIVASIAYGAPIWSAVLPFSIYLADVMQALIHRFRERKPVGVAHRDHVYQQLVDRGLTHASVTGMVGVFTLIECILALVIVTQESHNLYLPILGILVAFIYCALPNLTKRKIIFSH